MLRLQLLWLQFVLGCGRLAPLSIWLQVSSADEANWLSKWQGKNEEEEED